MAPLCVVRCREPEVVQKRLAEAGVGTMIHYPVPLICRQRTPDLASASARFLGVNGWRPRC